MRESVRLLVAALAVVTGLLAAADGRAQPAPGGGEAYGAAGTVVPVSLAIGGVESALQADHILHMDFKRLLAMITGVTLSVLAFESFIGGGAEFRFVAILVGGMIGDYWYRNNLWPFQRSRRSWWPW